MDREPSCWPFGVISFLVVVVDQLTKWWVKASFAIHDGLEVIPGFFNLVHVRNTGVAFGFLAGSSGSWRPWFFSAVAVLALVAIFFMFRHFRSQGVLYLYALASIAGGAIGNLIDRLCYGSVIDFLDFYYKTWHWPAFNVADSAIVVGAGLFLVAGLVADHSDE